MDKKFSEALKLAKSHYPLWLTANFVFIALLIFSHRPDAILHPQFWAEDGHVFYRDAYENGLISLTYPLGGYLNSFSRISALIAVQFPLKFGPLIFVFFSFLVQMTPPIFVLSKRMDSTLPSIPAQIALAYFYVIMPNCWEINLNLTDAQWHFAMVSFLIIVTKPENLRRIIWLDAVVLVISGLSGPFSLFLLPISVFDFIKTKNRQIGLYSVVLTFTSLVQLLFIIFSSTSGRGLEPLGVSGIRFCEILVNQILLGGMFGETLMDVIIYETGVIWPYASIVIAVFFLLMLFFAIKMSPGIFRKGVFFATFLFFAALKNPYLLVPAHKWFIMTFPGHGMRYYIIPTLIWFAAILICLDSNSKLFRLTACFLVVVCLIGADFEWRYPPYQKTNFSELSEKFVELPKGEIMIFPENPSYNTNLNFWSMVLTKK